MSTQKTGCHVLESGKRCDRSVVAHGLCSKHNAQLRRGRLGAAIKKQLPPGTSAEVTVRCAAVVKQAMIDEASKRTKPEQEITPSELWREAAEEWLSRRGIKVEVPA